MDIHSFAIFEINIIQWGLYIVCHTVILMTFITIANDPLSDFQNKESLRVDFFFFSTF